MRFKAVMCKSYRTLVDIDNLTPHECTPLYQYVHGFALKHEVEVDIKITPDKLAGDIVDEI